MANPFAVLDLSEDEGEKTIKHPTTDPTASSHKQKHAAKYEAPRQPKKEMQKQEQDLQQKKKGLPGARGGQHGGPAGVTHPGERSKIGLKKEPHVNTHVKPQEGDVKTNGTRVFDRHSGTGRGREMKKAGGGGHNWGKAGDETTPAPTETPEPSAPEGTEPAPAEPVVEEDPKLTLDEYEKLKASKRSGAAFEQKQARKVTAEAVGTVYKKDDEAGEGDYIKLGEEKKKEGNNAKKQTKQVFEIDIKFKDTAAPSFESGRGGRGGARGGGAPRAPRPESGDASRGAPRGGRGGRPATGGRLDTADQGAFPKLGAA